MTPLEEWYFELPIVTRIYITLALGMTLVCQLDLVMPFQIHYNYDLVFKGGQYWRLITSFLYFGDLSIDFVFHMFFLVRYLRTLEEGYFRNRTADFAWMLFLAMLAITTIVSTIAPRSNSVPFLSSPLTFTLIYLWSRTNAHLQLHFFGLFVVSAIYLPYLFLGFSVLLHGVWPTGDFVGLAVGHLYYFLDFVWVRGGSGVTVGGRRLERPRVVRAPEIVKQIGEVVSGMFSRDGVVLPRGFEADNDTVNGDGAEQAEGILAGATGEYEVWDGGRDGAQ